jgi:ABC-2 type transport system permease protein
MDWLFLTRDPGRFLMWTISDTALNIASVSGMLLIAARFSGIGVWSEAQFVFMLGYAALVEGLVNLFFGYNISFISRRLGRGQLDHTLIQPQPLWMSLLTEGFSPAFGLPTMVPGAIMVGWAIKRLHFHVDPFWTGVAVMNLAASVTIVMSFQFAWGSLAFWAPKAAEEINSSTNQMLSGLKSYPLSGLSTLVRMGLLTVLPVGFVAWAPAGALMRVAGHGFGAWSTPAAAGCFAAPAILLFRTGLSHYARNGSQRYSDFGHRS